MNDAELSLAVIQIMQPDEEWHIVHNRNGAFCKVERFIDGRIRDTTIQFFYTTDDGLGKMCVWLGKRIAVSSDMRAYIDFAVRLSEDNPHKSIAEAIVEARD